MMKKQKEKGLTYLQVQEWEPLPGLEHGFFTRAGGTSPSPYSSLNVGPFTGDYPAHIQENLRRIASVFSVLPDRILALAQVHGTRTLRISAKTRTRSVFHSVSPFQGDGLITNQPGIFLGILTADCVPALFVDPAHHAVGACHAGWRGTRKRVSEKILEEMGRAYGTLPEQVLVALGPCIGPCCYTVGEEVALAFLRDDGNVSPFVQRRSTGRWSLDLAGINRHQLLGLGVKDKNMVVGSFCTDCLSSLFFSVRAQGEPTGRQISIIGMKKSDGERGRRKETG